MKSNCSCDFKKSLVGVSRENTGTGISGGEFASSVWLSFSREEGGVKKTVDSILILGVEKLSILNKITATVTFLVIYCYSV